MLYVNSRRFDSPEVFPNYPKFRKVRCTSVYLQQARGASLRFTITHGIVKSSVIYGSEARARGGGERGLGSRGEGASVVREEGRCACVRASKPRDWSGRFSLFSALAPKRVRFSGIRGDIGVTKYSLHI